MPDVLLITPPFTQLNTPYPATAYIKGFLNTKGVDSYQMDLGIEVILQLFSREGLTTMFGQCREPETENAMRIYAMREEYIKLVDAVILFLQGKQASLARQIASDHFLPRASRFDQLDDMEWNFGSMGFQDKAKHLATMFLEDLSDFIVECVDDYFGFSRYAERLGMSANSFDHLYEELQREPTFIDEITEKVLGQCLKDKAPKLVCLSVPFPGNLYSALVCGRYIKRLHPEIKVAMGGGFANTELRSVSDPRVFEFWDYISLDDGELPLELIIESVMGHSGNQSDPVFLKRTFALEDGQVTYNNFSLRRDYAQKDLGTPDYSDLPLDKYISVIEIANPMHSLWSDGRWNKLTMAHGCYWGKCTFCDVSLSYIKDYEPLTGKLLVDRMEEMIAQTGESGFHFVDEAAPPALMRELAMEILKRGLVVSWWTNIRFEKSFTLDLCRLLKASGCIAISGGLEVASDRLLQLIDKGVTVGQVAQVTRDFTSAGIMVHAYLMYGYPTQTIQETIDSLEMVRQLFEAGVLKSAFWHQFALTAHSPVGLAPEEYGVVPHYEAISFANNDVQFKDQTLIDHTVFSDGLKKSLYNFMHDIGFDLPLQEWFDFEIPETSIAPDFIEDCLEEPVNPVTKPSSLIYWIGTFPIVEVVGDHTYLTFHDEVEQDTIVMKSQDAKWLLSLLSQDLPKRYVEIRRDYSKSGDHFEAVWYSDEILTVRTFGLLEL